MKTAEFPVLSYRDQSGGMISAVDDVLIPDNASKLSINFRHDIIGRATQRKGYARLGTARGAGVGIDPPNGIGSFTNFSGSLKWLVAKFGSTHYAWDGTTWYSLGGDGTSSKVNYATFVNLMFAAAGTTVKSWNGNTASPWGTAQLTGAPNGSLVLPYKTRLYISGDPTQPDRLYFSSIPDTSGNITWTSTDWLDVNPNDGDNITALAKTGSLMLIFKRNFMYRWNGTSTDPEPVINVGTYRQNTVATVNGKVIFLSTKGIFMTDGGEPVEISRPIANLLDNSTIAANIYTGNIQISTYTRENIFGIFLGSQNVSIDGKVYNNFALEYDTVTKTWQGMQYATTLYNFVNHINNDQGSFLASQDGDSVFWMEQGMTDSHQLGSSSSGTPITFMKETRAMEFDGRFSLKQVDDIVCYLTGGDGATFDVINEKGEVTKLGGLNNKVTALYNKAAKGNALRFRLTGTNSKDPVIWQGFDILKSRSHGAVK